VPDITPRASALPPVELVRGQIVELITTSDPAVPDVRIEVVEGVADRRPASSTT
jgi:hypothetical protein